MLLRTFTAPTMAEAIRLVRDSLGDDAVILGTRQAGRGGGVEVTAARDDGHAGDAGPGADPFGAAESPDRRGRLLEQVLSYHGVPEPLAGRLVQAALGVDEPEPAVALARAFDAYVAFTPLQAPPPQPIMLVGPPGAGKTTLAARLAARDVMAERRPLIATADTRRAGAQEQLLAFARLMQVEVLATDRVEKLQKLTAAARRGDPVYIDTPGINPYDRSEADDLVTLARAAGAEPVLVLPAGTDAAEASDLGELFRAIGVRRLVATRLDTSRRYGGLITAAIGGDLALAGATVGAAVAEPPDRLDAASLARVLFNDPGTQARPATRQEGQPR